MMQRQPDRRTFLRMATGTAALALGASVVPTSRPTAAAVTASASGADGISRETFDSALADYIASGVDGQHYHDNETGGLAWGQSYVLLGIMRMFQAYQDTQYLDTFVTHADAVLENSDERRGVTDYLGRSGPVWRTGGSYTASHTTLTSDDWSPVVQVRYASAAPAGATVEVRSGSTPDTFTLVMTHPDTGQQTAADVSTDPDHPRFVDTVVTSDVYHPWYRWTARALDGGVPATGSYDSAQQYYAFAVHTGMIIYPMALFARTVLNDPVLARSGYRGAAHRYLAFVHRAIEFHRDEYAVSDAGFGNYVWPQGAPVPFDGAIQPLNQTHGMGQVLAEMYRITGRDRYRTMVEEIMAGWRDQFVDQGGWDAWHYWPTFSELYQGYEIADEVSEYTPWYTPATQWEDISHAAISVQFAVAAHGAGIAVSADEVAALGGSYLEGLVIDAESVQRRFLDPEVAPDGTAVQAARWTALDQHAPGVAEHALGLYESLGLDPSTGSRILAIASLLWVTHTPASHPPL